MPRHLNATAAQPSAGEDVTVHLSVYIFLQQPHGTVDGYCRKRPCLVWIFIFQTRLSAHVTQTTFDLFKNHSTTNPSGPGETVGRCRHAKCCHFFMRAWISCALMPLEGFGSSTGRSLSFGEFAFNASNATYANAQHRLQSNADAWGFQGM